MVISLGDVVQERDAPLRECVRKMLNEGAGSFENFLRIARLLGFLDGVVDATNPLNTGIGRIRAEQDVPKRVRLG